VTCVDISCQDTRKSLTVYVPVTPSSLGNPRDRVRCRRLALRVNISKQATVAKKLSTYVRSFVVSSVPKTSLFLFLKTIRHELLCQRISCIADRQRSRHINIQKYFVRDLVDDKVLSKLDSLQDKWDGAIALTKSLPCLSESFSMHRGKMAGILQVNSLFLAKSGGTPGYGSKQCVGDRECVS
jgi:hypothetical protein